MHISYNWIKQLVPKLTLPPNEVAEALSRSIAEIETVSNRNDDYVFEVENKALSHRPDLFGHLGWGREVAAATNTPFSPSTPKDHPTPGVFVTAPKLTISIDSPSPHCRRYIGAIIDHVSVAKSPSWLINSLFSLDQRSINYIVDVTNYIMFKHSQPMHAFDVAKLPSLDIYVRFAKEGESIVLLDNTTLTLTSKDLVIDSGGVPIALAGIKGGKACEIDENTTTILLESAHFDMYTVRASSRRHALRSEASLRFEKGLSPCLASHAIHEAITLITGTVPEKQVGLVDQYPYPKKVADPLKLSLEKTKYYLNTPDRSTKDIVERLQHLGFKTTHVKDELTVVIPSVRTDVSIVEDLYEEIGRVYDYNTIVPTLPERIATPTPSNDVWEFAFLVRDLLTKLGATETLSYTFVDEQAAGQVSTIDHGAVTVEKSIAIDQLHITNPLAPEMAYMRTSIIPSITTAIVENAKRFTEFSLFEIGNITIPHQNSLPEEPRLLCLSFYSQKKSHEETLLQIKSIWRSFLEQLNITNELTNTIPYEIVLENDREFAYAYEIDLEILQTLSEPKTFSPIPVSMPTMQDLSFIIPVEQPVGEVINKIIEQANTFDDTISALVEITDRFQSNAMKATKQKSVTVRITFSHLKKSLSDSEVSPIREKIAALLTKEFSATIR